VDFTDGFSASKDMIFPWDKGLQQAFGLQVLGKWIFYRCQISFFLCRAISVGRGRCSPPRILKKFGFKNKVY